MSNQGGYGTELRYNYVLHENATNSVPYLLPAIPKGSLGTWLRLMTNCLYFNRVAKSWYPGYPGYRGTLPKIINIEELFE